MEAKELRIGNLVMSNGIIENENEPYILTVETIHLKNVKFKEINWLIGNMVTLDKFKPIPLTEGWLKVFGFERYEVWDEVLQRVGYRINKDEYLVMFTDEGLELCVFGEYFYQFETFGVKPMQYVHQLQNLYFALTGQELELKS